jgi:Putative metallopeptidase family (DUF6782)
MSGLRVVLLAFAICGVLVISERSASGAGTESDGSGNPNPEPPTARGVSEVDAFLGTRRSTRIAQIIPDHARACLPPGGGFRTTEAQQGIAGVADVVAQSPLGAWLLDQAAARLVLICQDPNTELAAYYRAQMRLIGLFDRLPDPARIMFLAHELAHVPQHPRYSNDLRFGPEAVLVMHRMREATAEAVATRVLWQLRVRGRTEPWRYKLESAYGDIAQAFARAMDGGGEVAELRATRAAFDQWFGRPGRVHSYDARILAHIARGRRPSLARPTRDLTEEFVRGIGWYGGANFLPPGAPPVLSDPYYARGLSPANAAQLDELLGRVR